MIYQLQKDRRGMVWDLLLYVPTVIALLSYAASSWYSDNVSLAYLLVFRGTFFFIAGLNRILRTRLMISPVAPVALELNQDDTVTVILRNHEKINLLKDLKIYKDFSGKSFGLSGLDGIGQMRQFVFHKAQFATEADFLALQAAIKK